MLLIVWFDLRLDALSGVTINHEHTTFGEAKMINNDYNRSLNHFSKQHEQHPDG